ncbi:Thioredoxin, mitochondrial [Smittium mucronatum]|uniref:Thioredoxin, mitochondrial n=1 Tax=Smittium mucronatum TaxID=133383 RepID=A0A1R0GVG3_9FUNG|nr:Thioredoxin, mitochondrial [Smittium mucronatum]
MPLSSFLIYFALPILGTALYIIGIESFYSHRMNAFATSFRTALKSRAFVLGSSKVPRARLFSTAEGSERGGSVIHVTGKTFKDSVLDSKIPTIVDFHADWCGPCRMLSPILESAVKEDGRVNMAKVDTETEHELALQYGITSLPTVISFVNGEVSESFIGFKNRDFLAGFIDKIAK